jgi:hypothetical protein
VSQRAAWVLVPRPLNYHLSDAVSAHVAPRNGGASVSGASWMHEASGTVSRCFALRHHAWMQANAVSQRAAWVLVPRPLNYRLSDAVSMGGRRRNGGASVSGANWMHEASGTVSRCFALRHHAWMQASAVSQRAGYVRTRAPGAVMTELPGGETAFIALARRLPVAALAGGGAFSAARALHAPGVRLRDRVTPNGSKKKHDRMEGRSWQHAAAVRTYRKRLRAQTK